MPLFEGHHHEGLERLFIEMPDQAKDRLVWKWADAQLFEHAQVNVDVDYQAVFTNLGEVVAVLPPGRHTLEEGAPLPAGFLVDHLTGHAYYNAELYFVATRERAGIEFGGPLDSLTDQPTGLVVTLRVFGELAFRITDPKLVLAKLTGTGAEGDFDGQLTTWVKDQTMAAIRVVVPDIVAEHGVLAMGQIQTAIAQAALTQANQALGAYGLAVTAFGELNVNLPDEDARQLKQLAATKAYSTLAGSFESGVRGQAALEIAGGVADGNVGAQPAVVAGMLMGMPIGPAGAPAAAPAAAPATASATATTTAAHFCTQCGAALTPGSHFCASCGAAVASAS